MDLTHLHLVLNHFPIIGSFIGMLLMLSGIVFKKNEVLQASKWIMLILAFITAVVMWTGEPAEHTAKNIQGVSEAMIDAHEDAAKIAFALMIVSGILSFLSIVTQFYFKKSLSVLSAALIISSFLTFGAMARTGYVGGKIRHTELNSGAGLPQENSFIEREED